MSAESDLQSLLLRLLPARDQHNLIVDEIEEGEIRLRFPFDPACVGPGGIVSGPLLLSFADTAIFAAAQSSLPSGEIALTSTLNVAFLRPAKPTEIVALSRLLRRGRAMLHAEAWLFNHAAVEPILHATASCVVAARSI